MSAQEELDMLREYFSMLREQVRSELSEREEFLLNYIERLEAKLEVLETRVCELERDRIHKLIALESKKLGISEEEFLHNVAEYVRKREGHI